jgi:hypothetical protein
MWGINADNNTVNKFVVTPSPLGALSIYGNINVSENMIVGNPNKFAVDFKLAQSQFATSNLNAGITGAGNRTVAMWVKGRNIAGSANTSNPLLWWGNDSISGKLSMIGLGTGKVSVYGSSFDAVGTTALNNNTWYHVAFTYDGTNIRIYLNGVLESTTARAWNTQDSIFTLGKYTNWGPAYFDGLMDDVRVYNRVLSAPELLNLKNGIEPSTTGLILNYQMNEGTGTTISDFSTSANVGNLTAGQVFSSDIPNIQSAAKFNIYSLSGSSDDLFGVTSFLNTRYFTINSSGFVGIGTTTPTDQLTIVNPTPAATTTIAIGSAYNTKAGHLCMWNGTNYTLVYFNANSITPIYATSTTCK